MKGSHYYTSTISLKYINDLFMSIERNLLLSAEKNNAESFDKLLKFYSRNFLIKAVGDSFEVYSKATTSVAYIYRNLNPPYKSIFLDKIFEIQIMTISYQRISSQNVKKKYIELTYLSLILLLKQLLREDNHTAFNRAFKNQRDLAFRIESNNYPYNYLFEFVTTLLCWIYYLQLEEKISYENYDFSFLEETFLNLTLDNCNNFLNSFFALFNELEEGLWEADNWEIKEQPVNQVFFALSARTWLKKGLLVLLLKFHHLITIKDDLTKIKLNDRFKYLAQDFQKEFTSLNLENKRLLKIISPTTISQENLEHQFNGKKEQILEVFNFLQKKVEIEHYKKILNIPLSRSKINKFRKEVGSGWESGTIIINILKHFRQVNFLPNVKEKEGYGFFQTISKGKFAFIDGEHFQNIHGLSNFGSQLAHSIDNLFFKEIKAIEEPKSGSNINSQIEEFLESIEDRSKVLIFVNRKNEQKIKSTTPNDKKGNLNSYKSYKDVPIIITYNNFKDYIFVIDFMAIEINIFESDSDLWYKNQLLVDVTNISKGIITDEKIKVWSEKDKFTYNAEEIDIIENNSVNIKIIMKFDYIFKKNLNFLLLDCTQST